MNAPTVTHGPLGDGPKMPNHPDLEQFFYMVLNAQDLVFAEGGAKYVIVSAVDSNAMFRFDKTDTGYTLTRAK